MRLTQCTYENARVPFHSDASAYRSPGDRNTDAYQIFPNNEDANRHPTMPVAPTNPPRPVSKTDIQKLMSFTQCTYAKARVALYNNNHDYLEALACMVKVLPAKQAEGLKTAEAIIGKSPSQRKERMLGEYTAIVGGLGDLTKDTFATVE